MALYFFPVKAQRRRIHLLLTLLLLLIPALLTSSRPLPSHYSDKEEEDGEGMVEGSMMIGSRPPRCQRICKDCGRCEAVQVPAIPRQRNTAGGGRFSDLTNRREEDNSNYKPLSWKCKCGDEILNP